MKKYWIERYAEGSNSKVPFACAREFGELTEAFILAFKWRVTKDLEERHSIRFPTNNYYLLYSIR